MWRARFILSAAAALLLSQAAFADAARDKVIAVVATFAKSWETGDLDQFVATLDDKLLWAHPGGTLDKAGAIAFFKKWKTEWKDTRIYPTQFIVEGNRVLAEYQFCATNIATGKREAEGTAAIGEVKDGKLVVWKEYYDHTVGALQAEGKIPVDEGAASYPYPLAAKNRW
jgi:ketosteroid isomerase-like protein